jgi:hypothetical protein
LKLPWLLCVVAFASTIQARGDLIPVKAAVLTKEVGKADIYLLLGQSNMQPESGLFRYLKVIRKEFTIEKSANQFQLRVCMKTGIPSNTLFPHRRN